MTSPNVQDTTVDSAVAQIDQEQNSIFTRGRLAATGGVVVAAALIGGALGCSPEDEASTPTTDAQAKEMCDSFEDANAASDASKYNTPQAFFPKTGEVEKADQVREYVQALFNENGPLAGNGDEHSLAAIMSMVVIPAHDGAVANTAFDYVGAYNGKIAAYQGENGKKVAVEDCKQAWATLNQVAELDDNWAQKGEIVTEIQAVRDIANPDKARQNDITGMTLVEAPSIDTIRGIKFKLGKTSKDLDGFIEVLLSTNQDGSLDGRAFVKGVSEGNVSLDSNGAPVVSITNEAGQTIEIKPLPNGQVEFTNLETGEVSTGPAPGNTDTGGSAGPDNTNPEAGPDGVTDSPATGGGTPTTHPGNPGTPTTVTSSPPTLPPITVTIPTATTTPTPTTVDNGKGSEEPVPGGTAPN